MSFHIQIKTNAGHWKDLRMGGPSHTFIETAIASACAMDEDGLFSSHVRIVDGVGKVVYTHKDYKPAHTIEPPDRKPG